MGSRWPAFGRSRPFDAHRTSTHDGSVRVLVLWNRVGGLKPGEDESWARAEVGKLRAMTALPRWYCSRSPPRPFLDGSSLGWCLEIRLAERQSTRELVRGAPFAEFLDDLRLLGMHPKVLALELELED